MQAQVTYLVIRASARDFSKRELPRNLALFETRPMCREIEKFRLDCVCATSYFTAINRDGPAIRGVFIPNLFRRHVNAENIYKI